MPNLFLPLQHSKDVRILLDECEAIRSSSIEVVLSCLELVGIFSSIS